MGFRVMMAETVRVAQIVARTEAEGPGWRWAVWVQGCPFRCEGCCNPGMLPFSRKDAGVREATVGELLQEVAESDVEGVSFLGGEPFAQAAGLAELARGVRAMGRSVMVFSGYTLAELQALPDAGVGALLAETDLLVDGRYDATLRTTDRRWIGSSNQVLHFLSERYDPLDPVFTGGNHLEIRVRADGVTINGWPMAGAATGKVLLRLFGSATPTAPTRSGG